MDAYSRHIKRKRRKTRKCLNEIRKRSRRNNMGNESNGKLENQMAKPLENETNGAKINFKILKTVNNNCITSNRLTLAMFPKAVRSETITRPALSEIQNKKPLDEMPVSKLTKNDSEVVQQHSMLFDLAENTNSGESSMQDEQRNSFDSSPLSFITINGELNNQNNLSPETVSMSTASSPSFDVSALPPPGYRLYQQFMEDLPTYLIEKAPTLVKDDVMKKTKSFLQQLYIDGYRQKIENAAMKNAATLNKMCFDREETFEQVSNNYIKYGNEWQQEVLKSITNKNSENHPSNISSAGSASSPNLSTSPLNSDTSLKISVIHDTPVYNYYPHKLN